MDQIMFAYRDVGMRANVAAQYSDLEFFDSLPLSLIGEKGEHPRTAKVPDLLARLEPYLERWAMKHPRLRRSSDRRRCRAAPSSSSRRRSSSHAGASVGLHTHLLSAKSQVPLARERFGGSTVAFLERIGAIAPWTSFAHAIWLDDAEVERLGALGGTIVHNP
jgi:cytosine/adenosine deaminase-related metal-dependent hydrolase